MEELKLLYQKALQMEASHTSLAIDDDRLRLHGGDGNFTVDATSPNLQKVSAATTANTQKLSRASSGRASESDGTATKKHEMDAAACKYEMAAAGVSMGSPAKGTKLPAQTDRSNGKLSNEGEMDGIDGRARNTMSNSARPTPTSTHTAGRQSWDQLPTVSRTPTAMAASANSTTYGQTATARTGNARMTAMKQTAGPPTRTYTNKRGRQDERPTYTDTVRLRNRDITVTRPAPLPRPTQPQASNSSDQRCRPPDEFIATTYRTDPTPAEAYGRDRAMAGQLSSTWRNSVGQPNTNLTPIAEQSSNGQRLAMTTSLAQAVTDRLATADQGQPAFQQCNLSTAERVPIIMHALITGELKFNDWLLQESGGDINGHIVNLLSALHHSRKSRSQYFYEQFHTLKARRLETQDARACNQITDEMVRVKAEHAVLAAIGREIRTRRHEVKAMYRLARTPSAVSAATLGHWTDKHRNDRPKETASQTDSPLVSDDDWPDIQRRNMHALAESHTDFFRPPAISATADTSAAGHIGRYQVATQTGMYSAASQLDTAIAGAAHEAIITADDTAPPVATAMNAATIRNVSYAAQPPVSDVESSISHSSAAHSGDELSSSSTTISEKAQPTLLAEQLRMLNDAAGLDSFYAERENLGRPFYHSQLLNGSQPLTPRPPSTNVMATRPSAFTRIAADLRERIPESAQLTTMNAPMMEGQQNRWPAAAFVARSTRNIARRPQTPYAHEYVPPSDTDSTSIPHISHASTRFRPPTQSADIRRYSDYATRPADLIDQQVAIAPQRLAGSKAFSSHNDVSAHDTQADTETGQGTKHEHKQPSGTNDRHRNCERGRDGRSTGRSVGRDRPACRKRGSDSSSSSRERKRKRGPNDSAPITDSHKQTAKTERPDADKNTTKRHRTTRKRQVQIKALSKKIDRLKLKHDGDSSDSGPSSSDSDRSSFSSDASSEDEELCADKLNKSSFSEKEFKRRAKIMDYDGEKESLDWRGFTGLAPYDPDSPEGERNFSNWHSVFVARANCQDLSYEGRKIALQCLTAGRAHVYVRHMAHKKYKYLVTRLQQIFGDGSDHVGYQEDYASQHQHADEYVDSYAARWLKNWRKHLGSAFDPDTKKTIQDFIATLRSDYVKTHLSAKGYKHFDAAVAHGRRLEREEAEYKRSRGQTDRATEYERRAAVVKPATRAATYSKSAAYAPTPRDSSQKTFWSTRFRHRPRDEAAALDGDQATFSATHSAANSDNDVEAADDSSNAEQFLDLVNGELEMAIDKAEKTNKTTDAVEAERLRNEIGTLIVKLRQMENQLTKRKSTVSATAPVGSCWKCGKTGHGWKLCPQRRPSDKLDGLPYKPAWAEEKIRRLRPTGPPRKFSRDDTPPTNTTATTAAAQQVQKYVAIPATDNKLPSTVMHSISCIADTDDDDDALFVVAGQPADTDHASATGVLAATVDASATGVANKAETNTALQDLRTDR